MIDVVAHGTVVMAATPRHPGFESLNCRFFSFLISLQAGCLPYIDIMCHVMECTHNHTSVPGIMLN